MSLRIANLDAAAVRSRMEELCEMLSDSVRSGASVGYLWPMKTGEAEAFWENCAEEMERGIRLLWVAHEDGRIAGAVQLQLATRPNSPHRAEVQKLLVHTAFRRRGIARALMDHLETEAAGRGRTLLVLDTKRGDPAEAMYRRLGWTEVGVIPRFVKDTHGWSDTVVFYKHL